MAMSQITAKFNYDAEASLNLLFLPVNEISFILTETACILFSCKKAAPSPFISHKSLLPFQGRLGGVVELSFQGRSGGVVELSLQGRPGGVNTCPELSRRVQYPTSQIPVILNLFQDLNHKSQIIKIHSIINLK
jgi:hypothetical protein